MTEKSSPQPALLSAVQRAISAWDTTTLKTNGDGMLSEAMESLRAEFDSAVMVNGLTKAETNETASVKGLVCDPGTSVNDGARVFARVMEYQGKTRRDVHSPNLTARECIALANYIHASDRAHLAKTQAPEGALRAERDQLLEQLAAAQREVIELRAALAAQPQAAVATLPAPAEGDRAKLVADLMLMVGRYWDLAYAEGKEGRNHDTKDGAAQRTLTAILSAVKHLAGLTPLDTQPKGTLTDEQIDELWSQHGGGAFLTYVEHNRRRFAQIEDVKLRQLIRAVATAQAPAPEHLTVQRLVSAGSPVGRICVGTIQAPAPAPEVPAGMMLVPREPTPAMLERARHAPIPAVLLDSFSARADMETKARWAAMLDAAPATQAPAVAPELAHIAALAHYGGLGGVSEWETLNAIRRLTLPWFPSSASTAEAKALVRAAITAGSASHVPVQGSQP